MAENDDDFDLIDQELYNLVDKLSEDDEDLEEVLDLILGVIKKLVDEKRIEDIPEEGASVTDQQHWINSALPVVNGELDVLTATPYPD